MLWSVLSEFAITSSPAIVLQMSVLGFIRPQNTPKKTWKNT